MTPTILTLRIECTCSPRSAFPSASTEFQAMLALFDGHKVAASVYSGTNKCFSVTKQMILDAWDKMDKEQYFWVDESQLEGIIEKYCTVDDNGHKLSMSIPNFFCFETPARIKGMMRR